MKIFYITTEDPALQNDLLETGFFTGARLVFGDNFIDIPRKKVMYGDFSDSPKHELHGRGVGLFQKPLPDVSNRDVETCDSDILLYGVVPETYGVKRRLDLEEKVGLVAVLDGHDDTAFRYQFLDDGKFLYFKREMVNEGVTTWGKKVDCVRPINFSLPSFLVEPINFSQKKQLYSKSVPPSVMNDGLLETGRGHHVFTDEVAYWQDLRESWFQLTSRRGGWDQLRHLESVAMGTVILWKNWERKPPNCAPVDFPTIGFHSWEEARGIMDDMVKDNVPTRDYLDLLNRQRSWLYKHGTCEVVACYVYDEIVKYMEERNET